MQKACVSLDKAKNTPKVDLSVPVNPQPKTLQRKGLGAFMSAAIS